MKRIIYLLLFISLLIGNKNFGNELINPNSNITYLGIEHGLSNNDVNCLYQSKSGFIWIGTSDGLNQYDGNQIIPYRKELNNINSLPSNHILDIIEDQNSKILISTKAGLTIFNPIRKSFESITVKEKENGQHINIDEETILESAKGQIFIGSVKHGLLIYDHKNTAYQVPLLVESKEIRNYNVRDIISANNKKVIVLIEKYGIAVFDSNSKNLHIINSKIKSGNSILYNQDDLLIGTDEGIYNLDQHYQEKSFQQTPKPVTNLQYFEQQIWASTDGAGIFIKNLTQQDFQLTHNFGPKGIFTSNSIKDILLDRDNNYWIATLRGGVNILNQQKKAFTPYLLTINEQLTNKNAYIGSFCEISPDEIWVGTDGYGLFSFRKSTAEFQKLNIPNLKSDHVTSIIKDIKGRIWVATWLGGIHLFDKNKNSFMQIPFLTKDKNEEIKNIWKLYNDKNGNLWASSYGKGGVFKWNEQKSAFILYDDGLKNVLTFTEDNHGNIWMGSDDYLIRHHPSTKETMHYSFGYRIRAIIPYTDETFWIGTEGNGLLLFDKKSGKYTIYDEKSGLSNNNILNILEDAEGNLWLSTFNGLNQFNPKTKKAIKYSEADGLQSNRFNYLSSIKLSNSDFVFGGTKGLNWFSPGKIKIPEQRVNIAITGIKVNGIDITDKQNWKYVKESTSEKTRLELPFDKGFLSISFSSFLFNKSNQIKYFAKLEGLSDDWIDLGANNYINYSRLPAGNYKLHIRTLGRDNTVQESNILTLKINPAWYWNPISISFYFLLIALIIFSYLKISKNRTKLIYEKKLALFQKEQEKEIGQKKLQFFTETLQELKTPITMVINPLTELMKSSNVEKDRNIQLAYRNANKLIVLLEQINLLKQNQPNLKLPSLKKLDIISVISNEFESFIQLAENKGLSFQLINPKHEIFIYANPQKIELIIFNLILNAIENANQDGKVTIELKEKDDTILISAQDSGPHNQGFYDEDFYEFYHKFKHEDDSTSLELLMIYQMVQEHQGKFKWTNADNKGNIVMIELNKGEWFKNINSSLTNPKINANEEIDQLNPGEKDLEDKSNPIILSNRENILIVENDPDLMNYLKGIFKIKYQVYEADNIDAAWEIIEGNQPNLILSEVFDDDEGFELCKKLKESATYAHIPLLFLSSSGSSEEQLRGITLGAEEFFIKPFDQEILLARVQAIIDGRSALQQYFLDNITLKENHSKISLANKQFLDCCIEIVENNLANPDFNAQVLAKRSNMSYSNLYKKVRSISGMSISAFIRAIRLKKAAVLMLSTENTINEIAFEVGIQDIKYFREKFKSIYGMSPSIYIKKYRPLFNKEFSIIKKTG